MVNIAVMSANVQGDIGGTGISRLHFQKVDASAITVADCSSAMAAWAALYTSIKTYIPASVTWSWQPQVNVIEHSSALVQAILTVPSPPANMVGTGSGNYAAGTGARVDWLTQSVHGRRFMRSSNYMVPLASLAYTATGALVAGFTTALQSGANTFLGAMSTAGLEVVAYGRPAKGTTTGGHVGLVVAAKTPSTPAGLRSRRS